MKKKLQVLIALLCLILTVNTTKAQKYIYPKDVVPKDWKHENSQSLKQIEVTMGPVSLLKHLGGLDKSYNWLQKEKSFNVTTEQNLTIKVEAGDKTQDILIGFDWDGDGTFETIQQASKLSKSPKTIADTKKKTYITNHTFTVTVPKDISTDSYKMRVLCDGDGYDSGKTVPPFKFDQPIGYLGSMHEFGVNVTNPNKVSTPKASLPSGHYKGKQSVSLSCDTEGALVYYSFGNGISPNDEGDGYAYVGHPIELPVQEGENKTVTLTLIAIKNSLSPSKVVKYTYHIQRSWSVPTGTIHATEKRFVANASVTYKGKSTPIYTSGFGRPNTVYVECPTEITVEQGESFSLTMNSYKQNTYEPMQYNHATIFADWNHNYSFDDKGEYVAFIGQQDKADKKVVNFTQTIMVPKDAAIGHTRVRVQYTDAWKAANKLAFPHKGDDPVVNGQVYDIKLNITPSTGINGVKATEAKRNNSGIYNIMGVKQNMPLNKLPKGVYIVDGKKITI